MATYIYFKRIVAYLKIHCNTFLNKRTDFYHTIVELKYANNCDDSAGDITRHLPFRVSKSSKYVAGIDYLK